MLNKTQIDFIEENKGSMLQKDIAKELGIKPGEVTRYMFNQRHYKCSEKFFNVNCKKTIKTNEYSWIT